MGERLDRRLWKRLVVETERGVELHAEVAASHALRLMRPRPGAWSSYQIQVNRPATVEASAPIRDLGVDLPRWRRGRSRFTMEAWEVAVLAP